MSYDESKYIKFQFQIRSSIPNLLSKLPNNMYQFSEHTYLFSFRSWDTRFRSLDLTCTLVPDSWYLICFRQIYHFLQVPTDKELTPSLPHTASRGFQSKIFITKFLAFTI